MYHITSIANNNARIDSGFQENVTCKTIASINNQRA